MMNQVDEQEIADQAPGGSSRRGGRNFWVIGWVGLVLAVLLVNLVMVYLAMTNNPGLVVDDYYERGKNYEETLVSRRARDPGWKMEIFEPERIDVGAPAVFAFEVRTSDGRFLDPEWVTLFAYRPSDAKADFHLPMRKVGPGRFEAEVRFPLKGVWDLLLAVRSGDQEYSAATRISAGT
mgnify:CR=1 FL=1